MLVVQRHLSINVVHVRHNGMRNIGAITYTDTRRKRIHTHGALRCFMKNVCMNEIYVRKKFLNVFRLVIKISFSNRGVKS